MAHRKAIQATDALAASPLQPAAGSLPKVEPAVDPLAAGSVTSDATAPAAPVEGNAAADGVQPALTLVPPPEGSAQAIVGDAPKRRGRPPGGKNRPRIVNPDPASPGGSADILSASGVDYPAIAGAIVDTITGACATIIGDEWKAEPHERKNLVECSAVYMKSKNFADIPPGWILCFAICAYALPRLTTDNTQAKIAKARSMILGR